MRIYLVNDCFRWFPDVVHYGCGAIMDSLQARIKAKGHTIVHVTPRPLGPVPEWVDQCDAVIINGEGTFRDEAKDFEPGRHDRMFDGISYAQSKGIPVYLTNAVWCRMGKRWAPLLRKMAGISTREPASAREIESLAEVSPEVHPDEAFFKEVPTSPTWDRLGWAIGDFYQNVPDVSNDDPEWESYSYRRLGLLDNHWNNVVLGLRSAKVYLTGQHHGVIAACKARCPFSACRVNTHKLTSLFEWAGADIPLANSRAELLNIAQRANDLMPEYTKLFDFLEQQTPWPIP